MPSNPKRPGTSAGNTFTKAEIDGVTSMYVCTESVAIEPTSTDPDNLRRQEALHRLGRRRSIWQPLANAQ